MNCYFTEPFINSETIKMWPKSCATVCGDINLVGDTEVTTEHMLRIFYKLEYLRGSLKIEGTKYTSLSFLSKLRHLDCFSRKFVISHNPLLENLEGIKQLRTDPPCRWSVNNNLKLDTSIFFETWENFDGIDLHVYGNLKDIECKNVFITSDSLPYYSNCSIIEGGPEGELSITEVTQFDDFSNFLNLKEVHGNIAVFETDLQNLSFMKNLRSHIGKPVELWHTYIHDNPKLVRLGWESLTILEPFGFGYTLSIKNNHPSFCLTTEELQLFAKRLVVPRDLEANLCPDLVRKDGEKVCKSPLHTMDADCIHVIGDLEVNSDNEEHVDKLRKMKILYGTLTVRGTKQLVDLNFLESLRQIVTPNMNGPPFIQILSNKKLQNVSIPIMKMPPFPFNDDTVIEIDGNSIEIFKTRNQCRKLQDQLMAPVNYNWRGCG